MALRFVITFWYELVAYTKLVIGNVSNPSEKIPAWRTDDDITDRTAPFSV